MKIIKVVIIYNRYPISYIYIYIYNRYRDNRDIVLFATCSIKLMLLALYSCSKWSKQGGVQGDEGHVAGLVG